MVARVLVAATSVAVALSLAGSAASAGDAAGSTSVYRLRADPRLCPSPQCGGFWASRVNSTLSVCLGGRQLPSCYAAEVGLSAFPKHSRASIRSAVATGRALIGGSFARYSPAGFPQLAKLVAVSAWLALGSGGKTGTVYNVVDTGVRCVRAPCFSLRATLVNGTRSFLLSDVDLSASGAPAAALERARSALARGGILAAGAVRATAKPAAGAGRTLVATQVWVTA